MVTPLQLCYITQKDSKPYEFICNQWTQAS
jgi:hypothetical protein